MGISNITQPTGVVTANTQAGNAPQVSDKNQVSANTIAGQKDFQVDVKDGLKAKLAEFVKILQNRDELIKSLPEDVQKAVSELLQEMSAEIEIPGGVAALLQGQKDMTEQLKNMGNSLGFAAILAKTEHHDIQSILQEILENFTSQSEKTPEEAAKDLLQLAKQLMTVTTASPENLKQDVEQLLQQTLPENMQQLTPEEQKIVTQLTKLLGKDMPVELQQLAQDKDLAQLPGIWATLKAADAWQLKDIQPKTLQAAADLLRQLAQEMPTEEPTIFPPLTQFIKNLPSAAGGEETVVDKMQQFVNSLPSEAGNKTELQEQLQKFIKNLPATVDDQGTFSKKLEQFVKNLPPEAGNKEVLKGQLTQFIKTLPSAGGNQTTVADKVGQFVKDLPPEVGNKGVLKTQLEQFIKTLPSTTADQVTIADKLEQFINNLPPESGNKTVLKTQLEQFIKSLPPAVDDQETAVNRMEQFANSLPSEAGNSDAQNSQLEQFIKTLPSEIGDQATVGGKMEQFIKTLPPQIGKALEQAVKQGNIPDNLRVLAEKFSNAALLNEKVDSGVQSFVLKVVENFTAKSSTLPLNVNDSLSQLAKQFTNAATTIDQLKAMINQLKTQLFAGDEKLLEKARQVAEQLSQILEQTIPQALQDGAAKHKLLELPKLWIMLKALGAEQWQNIESQNLQKSAGIVKELAQSVYKSTDLAGEKQLEHSILSFSVPLQVAEGVFYPAHIHIYHQEKNNESQLTERQFETWLRVSVDTENIGMVDSVFRLYADNKLDVRVNFPILSAADEFSQEVPNLRRNIEGSKLTLTDIVVNKT